jgi:membrane fusion protein (multidrug efflux system)
MESTMLSQGVDGPEAEDNGRNSASEGGAPFPGQEVAPLGQPVLPAQRWWWGIAALRFFVLGLAGGLVVLFATNWSAWISSAAKQTTDNAYVQADVTPLAAKVSGYIRRVAVGDFQEVRAGDLLVQIEDDDYRAQVAQAEANVQAAAAAIANIENQKPLQQALIRQAKATIAATESDVWRYRRDSERQQSLLANRFASPQLADEAMNAYQRAQATLVLNHAQLDQQHQQLTVLGSQETQARSTLKAQQAALDSAQINLAHTRIVAPVDGMVGQRQVKPGQYVGVGTQVISIVPLPDVWVVANYKETQMTRIRTGQLATITVDAFPDVVLKGHVDGWSPATGSQFSLLPADNATGNFTKVVQRMPVKIVLDADSPVLMLLRPGMSVIATIDTTATRKENIGAAGGSP